MQTNLNSNETLGGLGNREREIIGHLHRLERLTVTNELLQTEFNFSREQSNLILSRLCNKGWLQRFLPGVYGLIDLSSPTPKLMPADPKALAMELFPPCFLSGWTAAEHWEFTEQIFNVVVALSSKSLRTNKFTVAGIRYRISKIPPEQFFGTIKLWSGSRQIEIADPHRTIADILSNPEIGGGGRLTLQIVRSYFESKHVNLDTVLAYAIRMKNGALIKRLGFLTETFANPSKQFLEKCQAHIAKGVSLFDPKGPNQGPIKSKWNLRINIPTGDLL